MGDGDALDRLDCAEQHLAARIEERLEMDMGVRRRCVGTGVLRRCRYAA